MYDKVYNRLSTASNIGSRKICMDELVFLTYFVPPATPLPPPALEMDTQDAGVTLIRSTAKLLSILSVLHISQSWTWWLQNFLFAFWHTPCLSNCSQVLFLSVPCEMVYGAGIYLCEGSVAKHNDAFVGWLFVFNWFYVLNRPQEFRSWSILRCFDTVFQRPYRYFSIALKVFFSLSDRYKIFTSNWLCIEICENVVWTLNVVT